MADLLSTSISGLMAFQRALDTTSHNISNANTVGYSRQLTEFMTRPGQGSSSGWLGNGVQVSTIKRAYDDFLASQVRSSSSSFAQFDTYATQAGRVNNLFGDASTGLSTALQKFVNAFQAVADTPTSTPARQTLMSEAQTLVQRLQTYDNSLRTLETQANAQIETEASAISTLAQSIAKLNQDIAGGFSRTGQPPNDLLDQRDRLLDELATHVSVNVVPQGDHSVNVFIGNGQPLVVGQTSARIVAAQDPYDPTRRTIAFQTASGTVDITNGISGGSLGGILQFRSQMLDPGRNTLGRIAVGLQEVINDQHVRGMTLTGAAGADMFDIGDVSVLRHGNNASTATLTVTRQQPSAGALSTTDYLMTYSASGWSLQRADNGAAVTMTGSGTAADPFLVDGMAIEVDPAASVGDRFMIRPTADAVRGMQMLITNPADIAAAAPIRTTAGHDNIGSGTISAGEVTNVTADLRSSVTVTFTSETTYTLSGDPTIYTFTPGQANTIEHPNGWRIEIGGRPASGDTFTVGENVNGDGDNRNALLLAGALGRPVLDGGTSSLSAAVGQFVGDIGVRTNQVQVSRDAQSVVHQESVSARQSVSGVNLDEEAANLVRYQQAYMAAAQMIRVADTLFQSILEATRR